MLGGNPLMHKALRNAVGRLFGTGAGDLIELSPRNTVFSLDGGAKPGQSIGQHLYEGFSGIKDASQRPSRLHRAERC